MSGQAKYFTCCGHDMNVPPEVYAWKSVGFNGQPAVNVGPVCPACAWMLYEQDLLIDGALTQDAIEYYRAGRSS